jgi:RNA polymerase sigma-70 factor (ECF subfamily)
MSYTEMTDGELLLLLKEDNAAAFNTLFNRFWDKLHRSVLAKTGEPQVTFDIVQDVFVQLWTQRETLDIKESLSQYLAGMVRNKVFNYYRTSRRQSEQLKQLAEILSVMTDTEHRPIDIKEEKEKDMAWERAVNNLPGRMKEVFILRSRHQYSFRNIAEALNIKTQTAKNAFSRAQELLRDHFSDILPTLILLLAYASLWSADVIGQLTICS